MRLALSPWQTEPVLRRGPSGCREIAVWSRCDHRQARRLLHAARVPQLLQLSTRPIMEGMKVTATGYDSRPAHAAMQRYVDGNLLSGFSSAVLVGKDLVDVKCIGRAAGVGSDQLPVVINAEPISKDLKR
jgi:hypothetical protein